MVGRLESLSVTENLHSGDLLGEFFEQIVEQDFTQSKGQFFTPPRIVRFMLHLSEAVKQAHNIMMNDTDHLGRPRLPYVIDPSCGSGTFLIEYMKLIRNELGDPSVASSLARRFREAHESWFRGSTGNAWARDYLFGIENNYDLGLAAKVNMVLHGDGSMNTWISSALLPFDDYWVDGRHNVLGTSQAGGAHPYTAERNEQFDFILTNPPFSIKMSTDERSKVLQAFDVLASMQSGAVFVERWYQLLREGGTFCCVLPEALLDTAQNAKVRLFLLRHFKIDAVVSLPYDAFRPFTSTKTCILMASKRSAEDVRDWDRVWETVSRHDSKAPQHVVMQRVVEELGWAEDPIFMAEPLSIGYKRRKNLPDLARVNLLYREDTEDGLTPADEEAPTTVLDSWASGPSTEPSAELGFWTNLKNVAQRQAFRLDPKYRWLWDFRDGLAHGQAGKAAELWDVLGIVDLPKVEKGELATGGTLIDLEYVESGQALVSSATPTVDEIGSDKILFDGCELAISKLEPYLAKVLIEPPANALGSTEWVGLKRRDSEIPLLVLAYLLMLPDMREAYRRLQAGKRHARLNPQEFLSLKVEIPEGSAMSALEAELSNRRDSILSLRQQETDVRLSINELFGSPARPGKLVSDEIAQEEADTSSADTTT